MTVIWRGDHYFHRLRAREVQGIGYGSVQQGGNYWVDGSSGSATNSGKNPDSPISTIAAALDLCTGYNDDYIWVNDYYSSTGAISLDVASAHVIATGPYNVGQPMVYVTPSGDTPAFYIAEDFVELAGFEIKGGATAGGIEWSATKGYGRIHNCVFGRMQTAQDGIRVTAPYDAVEEIIEDCIFGSGITRYGIFIDHNMTRGIIRNNIFRAVTNIAINVDQMANGMIIGNRFMLPSDTAGYAITLAAACSGVYVADNNANFGGTDSMAQIPYAVTGGAGDGVTFDNNKTAGVVDYPA